MRLPQVCQVTANHLLNRIASRVRFYELQRTLAHRGLTVVCQCYRRAEGRGARQR
jgi:hypothetical protein